MVTLELSLETRTRHLHPMLAAKKWVENLRDWENGKRKSMPFAVVWREGKDYVTDCYFCITNFQGINRKNKHCIQYHDIPSICHKTSPSWSKTTCS